MSLVLTTPSNPGQASWQELNTLSGAVQVLKQRVQLADIQVAATNTNIPFTAVVPAGAMVVGAALYVSELPQGGGVGSVDVITLFQVGLDGVILRHPELIANGATGFIVPPLCGALSLPGSFLIPIAFSQLAAAQAPSVLVTADVNLDTLTNFDVTSYVFYTTPIGLTVP